MPLLVMIAGPYSAPTEAGRAANLAALNRAAAEVARRGHVPVVGVDAALPVLEAAGLPHGDPLMMTISLALAARCDAVLRIGRSPGADREVALITGLGRPVYDHVAELPPA
jgi:predicted signal transduction protein with EAL and GGDEF domain